MGNNNLIMKVKLIFFLLCLSFVGYSQTISYVENGDSMYKVRTTINNSLDSIYALRVDIDLLKDEINSMKNMNKLSDIKLEQRNAFFPKRVLFSDGVMRLIWLKNYIQIYKWTSETKVSYDKYHDILIENKFSTWDNPRSISMEYHERGSFKIE